MKAVVIEKFGGPEVLMEMDLPKPQPNKNEILIKISHAGVNPVDWKIREGFLQDALPHEFPIILGWDAAGVVESVGADITNYQAGDQVYAYCRKETVQHGTYAEYIVVDENALAIAPKDISPAEAASIPLAGLTAWQSLFDFAKLQQGQTVLIHAGAGGVGSLAIQFAKSAGAKVYTTASAKNHDYIKTLGADHIIDYTKENFVDVINSLEPEGVDVVFDTVGDKTQQQSFEIIKQQGVLVSIVEEPNQEIAKQKSIKSGFVFVSPNSKQLQEIGALIDAKKVKPVAVEIMSLTDAEKALTLNQQRHVSGKIILEV